MIKYDNREWLKITFAWRGTTLSQIWPRILFFTLLTTFLNVFHLYNYKIPPGLRGWPLEA